jgi:two-component system, response regulator YesN
MCRILIAEDDAISRKGLCKNIPWEENGFEIVGAAGDGEEGLQLAQQFQPELIISDIKMPFIDGLELARQVLEREPSVRIILLTAYEEFEYAKKALDLKIFDYILKPVDTDHLLRVAKQAVWEMENELKVQWQIRESRPLLLQRFFSRLVYQQYRDEAEMSEEAKFLEIPPFQANFLVIILKIDDYYNVTFNKSAREQEILKFTVRNSCEQKIKPSPVMILDPGGDELIVIYNSDQKPGLLTQDIFEQYDMLRTESDNLLKTTLTIGMGTSQTGLTGVATSYKEARAATEFRHILGKNQVLVAGMPENEVKLDLSSSYKELVFKIKLELFEEVLTIIRQIEKQFLELQFVSLPYVRLAAIEITLLILNEAGEKDEDLQENKEHFLIETSNEFLQLTTITEIFERIRKTANDLFQMISSKRDMQHKGLIKQAVSYIESHFTNENLSLREVAGAIFVSPIYLSIIFKKELNINFIDFVTDLRIKQAMNLLRNTDFKAYEVAEKVGYSNPHYFSVCFKKYAGCSPSEFKKLP